MPATPNKLTIDPAGTVPVTVDILDVYGESITCYDADGGDSDHTFPLEISAATDFFITANGNYTISVKYLAVEIGGETVTLTGIPRRHVVNPINTVDLVALVSALNERLLVLEDPPE